MGDGIGFRQDAHRRTAWRRFRDRQALEQYRASRRRASKARPHSIQESRTRAPVARGVDAVAQARAGHDRRLRSPIPTSR